MKAYFSQICIWILISATLRADTIVCLYGGVQSSPHSVIKGIHPDSKQPYRTVFGWEGKSTSSPPYYGAKVTFIDNDQGY